MSSHDPVNINDRHSTTTRLIALLAAADGCLDMGGVRVGILILGDINSSAVLI